MDRELFVQNIKKYCALRGVKPTVACRESGVSSSFISNITGRNQTPSVEKVQLLAQYLGVTVSDLLGEISVPSELERYAMEILEEEEMAQRNCEQSEEEILAEDEQQLVEDYRSLSPQGQEYIRQTMHMAVQTYKKSTNLSELEG